MCVCVYVCVTCECQALTFLKHFCGNKMSGTFAHSRIKATDKRVRSRVLLRRKRVARAYGAFCVCSISSMPNAKENRVHGNCTESAYTVTCVRAIFKERQLIRRRIYLPVLVAQFHTILHPFPKKNKSFSHTRTNLIYCFIYNYMYDMSR